MPEETHTAITLKIDWEAADRVVNVEETFHLKNLSLEESVSLLARFRGAAVNLSWIDNKAPDSKVS